MNTAGKLIAFTLCYLKLEHKEANRKKNQTKAEMGR